MAQAENKTFTIVSDTREKKECRWTFEEFDDKEFCGVDIKKLDIGDYSIAGLEDVFVIERKKSVSEVINNIAAKDQHRFKRELEKLKDLKYAYIICEFTINDLLKGSHFSNVSPFYVLSVLLEIEANLGITVHFSGKRAELLCYRLIRKIWMLESGFKRWT